MNLWRDPRTVAVTVPCIIFNYNILRTPPHPDVSFFFLEMIVVWHGVSVANIFYNKLSFLPGLNFSFNIKCEKDFFQNNFKIGTPRAILV